MSPRGVAIPKLRAGRCRVRHIRPSDPGEGTTPTAVLSRSYWPTWRGINAERRGFVSGEYEYRLLEGGGFKLTLPNVAGDDGVLHRERFEIILRGRATPLPGGIVLYQGGNYRPGDEFVEIYSGGRRTEPDFVGTPTAAIISKTTIEVSGGDGYWLLQKTLEPSVGYWNHAPRDVIEHHCGVWEASIADDFAAGGFTFNGADQVTADGRWSYRNAETSANWPGVVRLTDKLGPEIGNELVRLVGTMTQPQNLVNCGAAVEAPNPTRWRLEVGLVPNNRIGDGYLQVGVWNLDGTVDPVMAHIGLAKTYSDVSVVSPDLTVISRRTSMDIPRGVPVTVAIEQRDRWLYFYIAGVLRGVLPVPNVPGGQATCVPLINAGSNTDTNNWDDVEFVVLKRLRPFLMRGTDKGDYRLPGVPVPGGLTGTYFDQRDLATLSAADFYARSLDPTREPYASRRDPTIDFADNFQPPGAPEAFAARWTGSVNLDLATYDYRLRITNLDDAARLWVGKTFFGQQVAEHWQQTIGATTVTSAQLRSHLGTKSGWYPLLLEFADQGGVGTLRLEYERSDQPGVWTVVPATMLSEQGIYTAQIRAQSHYEVVGSVARDFGYQFRCEPRQLESGHFPGELVPRIRVGADYDKVVDEAEATGITANLSAVDVADALLGDAAGIADPAGGAQLTLEAINFAEAEEHLFLMAAFESVAEFADPAAARQRLTSLLAIRGGVWEELGAQPQGAHELLDSFPLSGQFSQFAWKPGDGLRLSFPSLGVEDLTPRPLLGVTRPFVPAGLQRPTVSFRARRRDNAFALRSIYRTVLQQVRNYQGTIATVTGDIGSTMTQVAPDPVARVSLPSDLTRVVKATVVVLEKFDASAKTIRVNNVDRITNVTRAGPYDITPYVARWLGTNPLMTVDMVGGTGDHSLVVVLDVRV